jgi:hypothetical protein
MSRKEGTMRSWRKFEANDEADKGRRADVPPPSSKAARIAKQIGEPVGRALEEHELTDTAHTAHVNVHDEASRAQQEYLEHRPGPHS